MDSINPKIAKFNIGDVVVHQRQGYRAVIIDIDPLFQASGRYNPQANKRSFSNQNPWYRLLVDESSQETYVEEPLLALDSCQVVGSSSDTSSRAHLFARRISWQ
ncbi:MAG: heat shock protein HspQ [Legionellaceae bacterium]|nr:heat shock protein HspQ [Legionellaceae bacterium]